LFPRGWDRGFCNHGAGPSPARLGWLGKSLFSEIIALGGAIFLGMALYLGLISFLNIPEFQNLREGLKARWQGKAAD
jgi:hypothetical protein